MDTAWTLLPPLLLGLAIGALVIWMYLRAAQEQQLAAVNERNAVLAASEEHLRSEVVKLQSHLEQARQEHAAMSQTEQAIRVELGGGKASLAAQADLIRDLRSALAGSQDTVEQLRHDLADVRVALHRSTAVNDALRERLDREATEIKRLQQVSEAHFERTAERLLDEKGKRMTEQNSAQLTTLITPLRERIQLFEQQIGERFTEQTRDAVSLRQEIVGLSKLNTQLSADANNLAGALRGNTKMQGDWGEWQLQRLLEASGLQDGIHFSTQVSYGDEDGRQKRPDCIINLPENKHLVVDSKVSLVAYERYCACDDNDLNSRRGHAADHIRSLRQHVSDLAGKNYTRLHQLNTPDFLFLFVPLEPAYGLALSTDQSLFNEALNRNVVIVTPTTLLSTLRTVSYLWKQDDQKRNVRHIARQSGLLYDSLVGFVRDLEGIGTRLDQAQQSYRDAFRKLSTGGKPGATILGRAEKIRKLGASAKKRLDPSLLEEE